MNEELIKKYGNKLYNSTGDFKLSTLKKIVTSLGINAEKIEWEKESDGYGGKETFCDGECLEHLEGLDIGYPEIDIPVLVKFFHDNF